MEIAPNFSVHSDGCADYVVGVRSDPLAGLTSVVRDLASADEVDDVLKIATHAAVDLLEAEHASVRLCTRDDSLRPVARAGAGSDDPPPSFSKGQGLIGWAALTGRVARVGDVSGDERFCESPERGFTVRSVLSVPIVGGARVMGVFSMSAPHADAFSDSHENLGVVLAHCLSQALRTAELEKIATTDTLTRAFNRGYLTPALGAEMNRARRDGKSFSVLLMDLDFFKGVNDRFGHAIGDAVLQQFADVVRGCVRSFDLLIRRGGEEFMLVMPGTTTEEAWLVAERIRAFLAAHPLRVETTVSVPQTVSIGLATWDGQESPRELDERADVAMYEAKHRGRNRIVVAPRQALWSN